MRFIDLFGGIGGFSLGLERTGHKCVWYCDNNADAVKVYNKNFGTNYETQNIEEVDLNEIPEFDLLCAGFPCQPFTIAGRREGFKDPRGTMFEQIARIIEAKKPKIILLENVKGLLNHDKGKTFKVIIQKMDELGYDAEWRVLNSKFFGVPQNRERVYIIGHTRAEPTQFFLYDSLSAGKTDGIYQCAKENEKLRQALIAGYEYVPKISFCLDASYFKGCGIGKYFYKGQRQIIIQNKKARRLTHLEQERLQGFPDNFTSCVPSISRDRLLGNAVTVNVIEELGKMLYLEEKR